jgi:hypothetical protein
MNIDTLGTMTLSLGRASRYGTIEVDVTKFHDHVQAFIFEYGIRQLLNDAMATKVAADGSDLSDDEIVTKAYNRRDHLYSGELRRAGNGTVADPFLAECYAEAKAQTIATLKKKGAWSAPKGTKNRFLFCINAIAAASGKFLDKVLAGPHGKDIKKRARATVDARSADTSLDELF